MKLTDMPLGAAHRIVNLSRAISRFRQTRPRSLFEQALEDLRINGVIRKTESWCKVFEVGIDDWDRVLARALELVHGGTRAGLHAGHPARPPVKRVEVEFSASRN